LIAGFCWPAIFFVNLTLGALALVLAQRYLPADRPASNLDRARFDPAGTLLLALTLAAYALAMTTGRGHFGVLNLALLSAAAVGVGLFLRAEARAASPVVPLVMFRNPLRGAGFAMIALVTTVVMATLVVGPFYLSGALALDAAFVGLVMSAGPIAAALTGVPAGRFVDLHGSHRAGIAGLVAGASVMGAVFSFAAANTHLLKADPAAVTSGMRFKFAVAAALTEFRAGAPASGAIRLQRVAFDFVQARALLMVSTLNNTPTARLQAIPMKHLTTIAVCCAALAAPSVHAQSHAEPSAAKVVTGPYLGVALGPAFGNREIDAPNSSSDEHIGRGAKIYGGYQLTEHLGVQAGYVRLHELNQNTGSGATLVEQTANGRSAYAAGTARLPLGQSFALTGKLGVSFGKVSAARPATAATSSLVGSKTSLLVGTGADYVLDHNVAFSVELESYGKLSSQVKGNTLTLGTRFTF
jgi:opacity protein-like surface antigen